MNCECAICKNHKQFSMPDEIVKSVENNQLVLFCGAGISTENKNVLPYSFYESIAVECDGKNGYSFPALMSDYCKRPNGRRNLLQKIKSRFDYIEAFPELERDATRFHKEVASIHLIDTIITTNWDDYFEKYCRATPITIPQDFVFSDCCDRQVYKIHGSIHNIGTIIATNEDYDECSKRLKEGIVGATLKHIMATKTIVFIGYSFGDEDFGQILSFIQNEMMGYMPHFYIVTLDQDIDKKIPYTNFSSIITDGTYFIHQLKNILISKGYMFDKEQFSHVYKTYYEMVEIHKLVSKINCKKYPLVTLCLSYQDGILHAFERFIETEKSGEYYNPEYIPSKIMSYMELCQNYSAEKNYWDEAYAEGYMNALIYMMYEEEEVRSAFPCF